MHKLTDASFQYEDADGKTQTVKGSLVIDPPTDGDYSASRNLGSVNFVTNDLSDSQAQKQADQGGVKQPTPPGSQQAPQ